MNTNASLLNDSTPIQFTCETCDGIFHTPNALDNHRRSHARSPWKCHAASCPYRIYGFDTEALLQKHLKQAHPNAPPRAIWTQCKVEGCDEMFSDQQRTTFETHMEMHRANGQSKRLRAPKTILPMLAPAVEQNPTIGDSTDPTRFVCESCSQVYDSNVALADHQRTHIRVPWRCHLAGCQHRRYGFDTEALLKEHLAQVHEVEPDTSLSAVWTRCEVDGCEEEYSDQQSSALGKHRKKQHANRQSQPLSAVVSVDKADAASYACETCDRSFLSGAALAAHQRSHLPRTFKCSAKGCPYVTRGFNTEDKLEAHIKTQHSGTLGSAPLIWNQCEFDGCEKLFSDRQKKEQEVHEWTHQGGSTRPWSSVNRPLLPQPTAREVVDEFMDSNPAISAPAAPAFGQTHSQALAMKHLQPQNSSNINSVHQRRPSVPTFSAARAYHQRSHSSQPIATLSNVYDPCCVCGKPIPGHSPSDRRSCMSRLPYAQAAALPQYLIPNDVEYSHREATSTEATSKPRQLSLPGHNRAIAPKLASLATAAELADVRVPSVPPNAVITWHQDHPAETTEVRYNPPHREENDARTAQPPAASSRMALQPRQTAFTCPDPRCTFHGRSFPNRDTLREHIHHCHSDGTLGETADAPKLEPEVVESEKSRELREYQEAIEQGVRSGLIKVVGSRSDVRSVPTGLTPRDATPTRANAANPTHIEAAGRMDESDSDMELWEAHQRLIRKRPRDDSIGGLPRSSFKNGRVVVEGDRTFMAPSQSP